MFIIFAVLTFLFLVWIQPPTSCGEWNEACEASIPALCIYIFASIFVGSAVEYMIWKWKQRYK